MKKFTVKLFGSAGVIPLEYDRHYSMTFSMIRDVESSLRYYYPVYTTACVWEEDEEGATTLVAEFKSTVKVERVISSTQMTDEEIEAHDRAEYEKDKQL